MSFFPFSAKQYQLNAVVPFQLNLWMPAEKESLYLSFLPSSQPLPGTPRRHVLGIMQRFTMSGYRRITSFSSFNRVFHWLKNSSNNAISPPQLMKRTSGYKLKNYYKKIQCLIKDSNYKRSNDIKTVPTQGPERMAANADIKEVQINDISDDKR